MLGLTAQLGDVAPRARQIHRSELLGHRAGQPEAVARRAGVSRMRVFPGQATLLCSGLRQENHLVCLLPGVHFPLWMGMGFSSG